MGLQRTLLGRVAETSWLYAIFHEGDAFQHEATRVALEPRPTLVASATMVETLDLMRYRLGKEAARRAERAMRRFPHFDTWYPVNEREALRVWREVDELSFSDAYAVALAVLRDSTWSRSTANKPPLPVYESGAPARRLEAS